MTRLLLAGALVVAVLLVSIPRSSAQTIDGCINKKTGTLRIAAASTPCTESETAISWNQIGPIGPQGPAGLRGPAGPQGPPGMALQVVDATGTQVGTFGGFCSPTLQEAYVFFGLDSRPFALRVNGTFFYPNVYVWYGTTDCSGTPYVEVSSSWPPVSVTTDALVSAGAPGQTVYYPQAEATPVSIAPRSHWIGYPNWQCEPYDCGLGCMRNVIPAYPLVDLNKMFTPPFKVVQVP